MPILVSFMDVTRLELEPTESDDLIDDPELSLHKRTLRVTDNKGHVDEIIFCDPAIEALQVNFVAPLQAKP